MGNLSMKNQPIEYIKTTWIMMSSMISTLILLKKFENLNFSTLRMNTQNGSNQVKHTHWIPLEMVPGCEENF